MSEHKAEPLPRAGSFLPERARIKKPWKRSKKAEEIMIQRQMRDHVIVQWREKEMEMAEKQALVAFQRMTLELFIWRFEHVYKRLPHMELKAENKACVANYPKLPKRMELFVAYLLHVLQARGDVIHYGWYEMYKEGNCIDGLGVDQWCLLAPKHG